MINELEKLARAATPGEWFWVGQFLETPVASVIDMRVKCSAFCYGGEVELGISPEDEAYIAAADPQTLLKLIEVIRAQHEALEAVKNDLLMRSEIDDDGTEVVDCGSSVWWHLGYALAKAAELGVK